MQYGRHGVGVVGDGGSGGDGGGGGCGSGGGGCDGRGGGAAAVDVLGWQADYVSLFRSGRIHTRPT